MVTTKTFKYFQMYEQDRLNNFLLLFSVLKMIEICEHSTIFTQISTSIALFLQSIEIVATNKR